MIRGPYFLTGLSRAMHIAEAVGPGVQFCLPLARCLCARFDDSMRLSLSGQRRGASVGDLG